MQDEMIITLMMSTRTTTFHENKSNSFFIPTPIPILSPTWKLYENPFYTCLQYQHNKPQEQQDQTKEFHHLNLPVSNRKIATSFSDLTFIKPFMASELDIARAQIMELKAQLEYERKARKKAESLNKKLTKKVLEEKKEREALEKVCEEHAIEITSTKLDITRLKKDMEEERRMLRVSEVLREERVQMKLNEAKFMLEEKISEMETTKNAQKNDEKDVKNVTSRNSLKLQRRNVSLEPENPHIRRGIRGFVEFPKVVRAIGLRSRHLGSRLECQKAQLMILLKQKTNPVLRPRISS